MGPQTYRKWYALSWSCSLMLSLQEAALSWFPISHRHDPMKKAVLQHYFRDKRMCVRPTTWVLVLNCPTTLHLLGHLWSVHYPIGVHFSNLIKSITHNFVGHIFSNWKEIVQKMIRNHLKSVASKSSQTKSNQSLERFTNTKLIKIKHNSNQMWATHKYLG